MKIEQKWEKTFRGEAFLLYLDGQSEVVIFRTDHALSTMIKCEIFLCDGNFPTVPGSFMQIFRIHAIVQGCKIPMAWAFWVANQSTIMEYCLLFSEQNLLKIPQQRFRLWIHLSNMLKNNELEESPFRFGSLPKTVF